MKTYTWTPGAHAAVDAQVAGKALEKITSRNGGALTPKAVVEESRPKTAPLHACFEWNDGRAAEKYREDQARSIIRSVRIVQEGANDEEAEAIAYFHVTSPKHGACYQPASVVMSDEELRQQALQDALTLLQGVRKRFAQLKELKPVFAAIDRIALAKAGKIKPMRTAPAQARRAVASAR